MLPGTGANDAVCVGPSGFRRIAIWTGASTAAVAPLPAAPAAADDDMLRAGT